MPYWVKMEKFLVTEFGTQGEIKGTKRIGTEWFENKNAPEPYKVDAESITWANTTDADFGKEKPTRG